MKTPSAKISGSSLLAGSASIILAILQSHERRNASRIPQLELRSRVLQRLQRTSVKSLGHLYRLIAKMVEQVILDYGKEQRRHYRRHVYGYDFDRPAPKDPWLVVEERKEELLGPASPLSGPDKALLQIAFDEADRFVRSNGQLNQTRMAKRLGTSERSVGRRWEEILNKVEAWQQGQLDLSI